jgi:hypothetical protein
MLLLLIILAWALAIVIVAGICLAASTGDAELERQGALAPGHPHAPAVPGEPGLAAPQAARTGEARELAA